MIFSKTIPLKIEFVHYDDEDELLIFEIILNSDSKTFLKVFNTVLNYFDKKIASKLPKGETIGGNYLPLSLSEIIQIPNFNITFNEIVFKSQKFEIQFDIDND